MYGVTAVYTNENLININSLAFLESTTALFIGKSEFLVVLVSTLSQNFLLKINANGHKNITLKCIYILNVIIVLIRSISF